MAGPVSFIKLSSYIILLTLLPSVTGQAGSAVTVASDRTNEDVDLVSFLNSRVHKHDAIFTEAIELLESMKSSPSCNRIAASKLVASCQSIGRKSDTTLDSDTYVALDYTRSLYAARLAICEISGAGASVPSPCLPVNVLSSKKRGIFDFSKRKLQHSSTETVPKNLLESCLMSLESRPQWWTSYSNSRQNAVVICQAARAECEKEELLELHKSIVESSMKLNQGFQEALQMAAAESSRQKDFMHSMEAMRVELMREMDESTSYLKGSIVKISHNIETQLGSVVSIITSALGSVHADVTTLEKDIRNVTTEAGSLHRILQNIHDETMSRSEEMALSQRQHSQTHDKLASSIQEKLRSVLQGDIIKLHQSMGTFDASLELLYERVGQIFHQEENMSERFRGLGASLDEFQSRIENIHKTQLQQYEVTEAQSRLQDTLQINMQIAQTILDQTVSTAANLQTMIDETTTTYRSSPAINGIIGRYWSWIICCLLFGFLGIQNPRIVIPIIIIGLSAKIL